MKIFLTSLLIILTIGCTSPTTCHEKNGNECFASTITGVSYPIDVYLPPEYDSTDISYPVIYVTDGEWHFSSFYANVSRKQLPAIIVAIGNTDNQPQGRRAIDYLPPGSSDYYQFLSTEWLPYIESKYRIATENRSVFGHSYGGRLVADILFMEPPSSPLFHNYISADPSLWSHAEELIELAKNRYTITPKITGRLLITGATGTDGNIESANRFEEKYKESGFKGLEITKHIYDTNHFCSI
jgi:predicted alpha/beta superfamily hydrolase